MGSSSARTCSRWAHSQTRFPGCLERSGLLGLISGQWNVSRSETPHFWAWLLPAPPAPSPCPPLPAGNRAPRADPEPQGTGEAPYARRSLNNDGRDKPPRRALGCWGSRLATATSLPYVILDVGLVLETETVCVLKMN